MTTETSFELPAAMRIVTRDHVPATLRNMNKTRFRLPTAMRFVASELSAAFQAVAHSALLPPRAPDVLTVNDRGVTTRENWREVTEGQSRAFAAWDDENTSISVSPELDGLVCPEIPEEDHFCASLSAILDTLQRGPDWHGFMLDYEGYSQHRVGRQAVGWGFFFKGASRERNLISSRWLDHGPFLHRAYGELTMVYFHELDVDLDTRREQAASGHRHMVGDLSPPGKGGFLSEPFPRRVPPGATYVPDERRVEIAVHGREVPMLEMVDARSLAINQILEGPVERVTYTFAELHEAKAHLHDMWLRDIEVVSFVDGFPTVLTDDYDPPPPDKPEWVGRLASQLDAMGL